MCLRVAVRCPAHTPLAYVRSLIELGFFLLEVKLRILAHTLCNDCSGEAVLIPQPCKNHSCRPSNGTNAVIIVTSLWPTTLVSSTRHSKRGKDLIFPVNVRIFLVLPPIPVINHVSIMLVSCNGSPILFLDLVAHSTSLLFAHLLMLSFHLYRCLSLAYLPSILLTLV